MAANLPTRSSPAPRQAQPARSLPNRSAIRPGTGRVGPDDSVMAMIRNGTPPAQSRVVDTPKPGDQPARLAPGEVVLDRANADLLAAIIEEWEQTGKIDDTKVVQMVQAMRNTDDEAGDPGEVAEGFGCGGQAKGYAGGGVIDTLRGWFENPNVARNRREIEQMKNGTYQGQPPAAPVAPPPPALPSRQPSAVDDAAQALGGRKARIDKAVDDAVKGYSGGGYIPGHTPASLSDQLIMNRDRLARMTSPTRAPIGVQELPAYPTAEGISVKELPRPIGTSGIQVKEFPRPPGTAGMQVNELPAYPNANGIQVRESTFNPSPSRQFTTPQGLKGPGTSLVPANQPPAGAKLPPGHADFFSDLPESTGQATPQPSNWRDRFNFKPSQMPAEPLEGPKLGQSSHFDPRVNPQAAAEPVGGSGINPNASAQSARGIYAEQMAQAGKAMPEPSGVFRDPRALPKRSPLAGLGPKAMKGLNAAALMMYPSDVGEGSDVTPESLAWGQAHNLTRPAPETALSAYEQRNRAYQQGLDTERANQARDVQSLLQSFGLQAPDITKNAIPTPKPLPTSAAANLPETPAGQRQTPRYGPNGTVRMIENLAAGPQPQAIAGENQSAETGGYTQAPSTLPGRIDLGDRGWIQFNPNTLDRFINPGEGASGIAAAVEPTRTARQGIDAANAGIRARGGIPERDDGPAYDPNRQTASFPLPGYGQGVIGAARQIPYKTPLSQRVGAQELERLARNASIGSGTAGARAVYQDALARNRLADAQDLEGIRQAGDIAQAQTSASGTLGAAQIMANRPRPLPALPRPPEDDWEIKEIGDPAWAPQADNPMAEQPTIPVLRNSKTGEIKRLDLSGQGSPVAPTRQNIQASADKYFGGDLGKFYAHLKANGKDPAPYQKIMGG